MTVDQELHAWREQWASQAGDISDLGKRVKRQSRYMRFMLAAEMLVTVVMGGGTLWMAVDSKELDFSVLAGATWMFLAAAWGFGIWNRHGAWRPVSMTSSAYLEISIRRSRSAIRAVIFGMVLFAIEMVFCLGWIYKRTGGTSFLYSARMIAVGMATVWFFAWSLRYRARKKAELAGLIELAKSTLW